VFVRRIETHPPGHTCPGCTHLPWRVVSGSAGEDGVDAWLDKEKLLPGQGFDRLNLPDWELEIRKAVRERV